MIVTDQQRRDTIGAYGSPICNTPNVDRLSKEGVTFDYAFTPCGLCSPVRSSFFSGVYPHEHEVLTNVALHPVRTQFPPEKDIVCRGLKEQGYRMGYVGKWHVNHYQTPLEFGFEKYVSLGDFENWRQEKGLPLPPESHNYLVPTAGTDPAPEDKGRPAFLADNVIQLMEEFSGDPEHPFFLRLDFHGPHPPMVIPEPYASMYDPQEIPPYPNFDDPLTGKPSVQRIKRKHWQTEDMTWADMAPLVAKYFGEISYIDVQVGRVLDKLDKMGLTENTIVIFTSDHGDTIGAHKIWNKDYTMYDEIYRVPCIIRWPKTAKAGHRCQEYTHHFLDLGPTLLEAAGSKIPDDIHGQSLLSLLKGESQDRPREAFSEFHGCHMGLYTMRMLQTDDWKYIFHANDIDELYDQKNDPYEMNNLSENPACAEVLKDMKLKMVERMKRTKDHLYNEWIVYWLTGDRGKAIEAPGRTNTKW